MDIGGKKAIGVIAVLGLISTIVLGVTTTYYARDSVEQAKIISDTKEDKIEVKVLRQIKDEPFVFRPSLGKYSKSAINSHWDIYLINPTDKNIPILSAVPNEFLVMELDGKWQNVTFFFPDLKEALVDADSGQTFEPTSVPAGGTKHLILTARVEISDLAYDLLSFEIRYKPDLTIPQAEKILNEKGTDLFGNRITFVNGHRNIDYLAYHPNKGTVAMKVTTGSHRVFSGQAAWYDNTDAG